MWDIKVENVHLGLNFICLCLKSNIQEVTWPYFECDSATQKQKNEMYGFNIIIGLFSHSILIKNLRRRMELFDSIFFLNLRGCLKSTKKVDFKLFKCYKVPRQEIIYIIKEK